MSARQSPASWLDPQYVSTVVGVLAVGTLVGYGALSESAPSPETSVFVLLWVTLPMTAAYELARRLR